MSTQKLIELSIICYEIQPKYLQYKLVDYFSKISMPTPQLIIKPSISRFRTLEPSVLVAIVSGSGVALGALISGLLKISQSLKNQKIVIQSKSGDKLEFPANTPIKNLKIYN